MGIRVTQEKALRWAAQGTMVALVLVAAYAIAMHLKVGELESLVSQAQAETDKARQDSATARKKMQDELAAANARAADLERKQRETDSMKALLAKIEPQIAPVLEAAGKAGKPDARAAALAGVGLIGQITHGANHEAALAALDRSLSIDKASCVAGLAINLSGTKKVEVGVDCQAMLPGPAPAAKPAADAKPAPAPAAEAKPAADAKGAPAPASGASKAVQPAGKG